MSFVISWSLFFLLLYYYFFLLYTFFVHVWCLRCLDAASSGTASGAACLGGAASVLLRPPLPPPLVFRVTSWFSPCFIFSKQPHVNHRSKGKIVIIWSKWSQLSVKVLILLEATQGRSTMALPYPWRLLVRRLLNWLWSLKEGSLRVKQSDISTLVVRYWNSQFCTTLCDTVAQN